MDIVNGTLLYHYDKEYQDKALENCYQALEEVYAFHKLHKVPV